MDISLLTLREEKRRRRKVFAVAWRRGSSSEESFFSAFDSQRPRRGGEEVFRDRTEEEGESVMSDGQNTRLEKNEWRKKALTNGAFTNSAKRFGGKSRGGENAIRRR